MREAKYKENSLRNRIVGILIILRLSFVKIRILDPKADDQLISVFEVSSSL